MNVLVMCRCCIQHITSTKEDRMKLKKKLRRRNNITFIFNILLVASERGSELIACWILSVIIEVFSTNYFICEG